MPTFEYDMKYLQAGVDLLEKYLLAADLYWPLGVSAPHGETAYPPLTLGMLLLSRRRAEATAQSPAQQAELERLSARLETVRSQWRTAWGKKAAAEFRARLNLWGDFLSDYRRDPEAHYDRYAYEVGRRVLLKLLGSEAEGVPAAQTELLASLDKLLKTILVPGEFVWEPDLAARFPRTEYWYLYGKLSKSGI